MDKVKQIEIRLTKCIIILTEPEVWKLLQSNPEILRTGIGRGKAYRRTEAVERRKKGGKEHE